MAAAVRCMSPPLVREVLRLPPELGPDPLGELVPVPVTAPKMREKVFIDFPCEGRTLPCLTSTYRY